MRKIVRQKLDIPEPLFDTTFRVRDTETPQRRNSTGLRAVIFLSSLMERERNQTCHTGNILSATHVQTCFCFSAKHRVQR